MSKIHSISVRQTPAMNLTEDAISMVKMLSLETILAAIDNSIEELARQGAPIKQAVVEKEIDPEIRTRQVLAITVWVQDTSPEIASSLWKSLYQKIAARKALLNEQDQQKFDSLVSVGVDVE